MLEEEEYACVWRNQLELVRANAAARGQLFCALFKFFVFLAQVKEELTSRARAAATSGTANGASEEEEDAEGMLPCIPVVNSAAWYVVL